MQTCYRIPLLSVSRMALLLGGMAALIALVLPTGDAHAHLSIIRQGPESAGFRESGDRFGHSVVGGDFDGDGRDDLATGCPFESASGAEHGSVIINYGSSQGLTHVGATTLLTSNFGVALANQRFGYSLASADLNDDGFDDLVVGAPFEDVFTGTRAGRIYIYAGSPTGLVPWWSYVQEDLDGFSATDDVFGFSLATGNLNNDIYEDIVIGSPCRGQREGTVFVVYGTATGPFGSTDLFTAEQLGASLDIEDHFGFALAVGNVIGDTREDIVVGAPFREAFGQDGAGVCYAVPGGNSGIVESAAVPFTAKIADDVAAGADFGFSLATLPSGVYDQIAIGERDRYVGSVARAGRVLVVTGGPDGPNYDTTVIITQETLGGVSQDFDSFGTTLASGYFESDSFMDLAIGTPGKDFGGQSSSGMINIVLGGTSGLGSSGYYVYTQPPIGDPLEAGDEFGFGLAFGAFDATGNGHLIVGAPGEDGDKGQVHVIAPWRQFLWQGHKTAMVRDCQGDIVFSQKMFDQVYIASTTKIMTVLLACERAQLPAGHPDRVPLNAVYTVPEWCADDIGGSTADLEEDEQITLSNLMYLALHISGNDAAHAIADLLQGSGGPESVGLFVGEMNNRAIELGMFDTSFNNPNGFEQEVVGPDWGDHYSTAYDMEILSRAAMANELFFQLSTEQSRTITRDKPSGEVTQMVSSFQTWILNNNMGIIGTGLKGGWTPAANETWCISAEGVISRAIVTTFGSDQNLTPRADAGRLLTLGLNDCATWQPVENWTFEYLNVVDGILAETEDYQIYSMNPTQPMDMQLNLFQANAEVAETHANVHIRRLSEIGLDHGETMPFGISPFEAHEAITITNLTDHVTKIFVETPLHASFYNIGPGGSIQIPGGEEPTELFQWTITSHDGEDEPLHLAVEEHYRYEVDQGPLGTTTPAFRTTIERADGSYQDQLSLEIYWISDGGEHVMTVHEPDAVVNAPDFPGEWTAGSSTLQLSPAAPNPFTRETAIRFALRESAEVGVTIHDVAGRTVREYDVREMTTGFWTLTWDGRFDDGADAAPGVYFYQVSVDGTPAGSGKLSRIR